MSAPDQSSPAPSTAAALDRLLNATLERYPLLIEPFDPEWRSTCESGGPFTDADLEGPHVAWQPRRREDTAAQLALFDPLARALEIDVHPDITTYYSRYYSGGIEADSPEGPVSLLQLWNEADAERLIENLLGHAIAKQRAKAPYSVFFACTAVDSELFLSVENHTGHVVLERPGYKPERTVATSLGAFLGELTPAPPERHPERAAFLVQSNS